VIDRLIRITPAMAVTTVAVIAAAISYRHAYELVVTHGSDPGRTSPSPALSTSIEESPNDQRKPWQAGLPMSFGTAQGCFRLIVDWDDQAGFVGEDDGLGAVAQAQLRQQVAHVGLDRVLGDHQIRRDFGVGSAPREQP